MHGQYRQGDYLLETVDSIPAEAKLVEREDGRVIVGRGEKTGHHHAIAEQGVELLEAPAHDWPVFGEPPAKARFLSVPQEAYLVHEEHNTVTLPAGNYRVIQQRQYTPAKVMPVWD
jgi:hypothetical protein